MPCGKEAERHAAAVRLYVQKAYREEIWMH
jgi:hypothetical protein